MNESPLNPVEKKVLKIISPFEKFIDSQTSTGLLLAFATILAMVIANMDLYYIFQKFIHAQAGLIFGSHQLKMPIEEWVGSGLMALFFFLLGLELKRECLAGELQIPKRIGIVLSAALGGMVVPVLIYYLINSGGSFREGWAIPMATDTAFALGTLAFFKHKMSKEVFIFLTGLAIFDDLGAIAVIAIYYTRSINIGALYWAGSITVFLVGMNICGFRSVWLYMVCGLILWWFIHISGIHATVAGVIVALTIPARPRFESKGFVDKIINLLSKFERHQKVETEILADQRQSTLAINIEDAAKEASTPLQRWELKLENPIGLGVLPIFALFSAGIRFSDQDWVSTLTSPLTLGIVGGLVVGKPLGIFLFSIVASKLGVGALPEGMTKKELLGIGLLAGMGFTMSIFISLLAFKGSPALIAECKLAILVSTLMAGFLGALWLFFSTKPQSENSAEPIL